MTTKSQPRAAGQAADLHSLKVGAIIRKGDVGRMSDGAFIPMGRSLIGTKVKKANDVYRRVSVEAIAGQAAHTPIPGPFRSIGNTVQAVSHGQWFSVVRCDNPRFTPESKWAMAAHVSHCLNDSARLTAENARLTASHAALVAALEAVELRLTQTRLASNIGRESSVRKADFLRGQCESIARDARAALAQAKEGQL
jgi:hypothetical protein